MKFFLISIFIILILKIYICDEVKGHKFVIANISTKYPEEGEKNYFYDHYIDNYLFLKIKLGSDEQNIEMKFELNNYETYIVKEDFVNADIVISNKSDKALAMKLCEFDEAVEKSFDARGVHILVQYIYELATVFNDFYHNCKIVPEKDLNIKKSWLKLSQMTLTVFNQFANIIKINIPERM